MFRVLCWSYHTISIAYGNMLAWIMDPIEMDMEKNACFDSELSWLVSHYQ